MTHHGTHGGSSRTVPPSLNRTAFSATVHCLTGCAIGEIAGMVLGGLYGWTNWTTVAVSVVLAFIFGYSFTLVPLVRSGIILRTALALSLASDTLSIAVMEIIDNAIMLLVPGAMDAGIDTVLFWTAMGFSLLLAGAVAFPINRWLIARGRGHALVHSQESHHPHGSSPTGPGSTE